MFSNEKVDMRIKYTREWTFEAVVKLLEVKEYNDIKISEIINKAGISRATFYRNFSSKEDIVRIKVSSFFHDFYEEIIPHFYKENPEDELYLIQMFFKKIDEDEKLIDTVIKSNLEYLMVEGIHFLIINFSQEFYQLVRSSKITQDYTIDIVSSSVWTLLSRWYKTGKKESVNKLGKIFLSAFRNVYLALFDDKSLIGD
jgi:hypothetical protein